jgi:hypothetical protein
MGARSFRFNEAKFKELVLYIASKAQKDPTVGAIKLNKILYYSDFIAYKRLGRPITGAAYQKLAEGPAPRRMVPIRRMMVDSGRIRLEERPYFNGMIQRIIPTPRVLTPKLLSSEEVAIVDEVLVALAGKTAREVSDMSHRELGWILARPGETIPYETAWLSSEPLPQEAEILETA